MAEQAEQHLFHLILYLPLYVLNAEHGTKAFYSFHLKASFWVEEKVLPVDIPLARSLLNVILCLDSLKLPTQNSMWLWSWSQNWDQCNQPPSLKLMSKSSLILMGAKSDLKLSGRGIEFSVMCSIQSAVRDLI